MLRRASMQNKTKQNECTRSSTAFPNSATSVTSWCEMAPSQASGWLMELYRGLAGRDHHSEALVDYGRKQAKPIRSADRQGLGSVGEGGAHVLRSSAERVR